MLQVKTNCKTGTRVARYYNAEQILKRTLFKFLLCATIYIPQNPKTSSYFVELLSFLTLTWVLLVSTLSVRLVSFFLVLSYTLFLPRFVFIACFLGFKGLLSFL